MLSKIIYVQMIYLNNVLITKELCCSSVILNCKKVKGKEVTNISVKQGQHTEGMAQVTTEMLQKGLTRPPTPYQLHAW